MVERSSFLLPLTGGQGEDWINTFLGQAIELLFIFPFICRELPFQKGDIVYIIRQVDQNWYEGEHHGRVGIFPQSYVEVCAF